MLGTLAQRLIAAPRTARLAMARRKLESVEWPDGKAWLDGPGVRALLLGVADHSPFLWGLIEAEPARAARLFAEPPEARLAAILEGLAARQKEEAALMRDLRRAR